MKLSKKANTNRIRAVLESAPGSPEVKAAQLRKLANLMKDWDFNRQLYIRRFHDDTIDNNEQRRRQALDGTSIKILELLKESRFNRQQLRDAWETAGLGEEDFFAFDQWQYNERKSSIRSGLKYTKRRIMVYIMKTAGKKDCKPPAMKFCKPVLILVIILILSAVIFYYYQRSAYTQDPAAFWANKLNNYSMTITSPAFLAGAAIPKKYSCQGQGVNPPLIFSGTPKGAKSLALIVDDPDVPINLLPSGLFVHWIVYNMPPGTSEIAENSIPPGQLGLNGAGKPVFTPPCPPDRQHRYFFKLFALDSLLSLSQPPTEGSLAAAMAGHIIGQAELMGTYDQAK